MSIETTTQKYNRPNKEHHPRCINFSMQTIQNYSRKINAKEWSYHSYGNLSDNLEPTLYKERKKKDIGSRIILDLIYR